jgi:hypothetical protein
VARNISITGWAAPVGQLAGVPLKSDINLS